MRANRMWLYSDVLEKNKRIFKVPVYQRNYDWSNIQCENLFRDIMKAYKSNYQHFIGTIVYIEDINGGSGLSEDLIIDGQQRITTIYILLKALYDISIGKSSMIENEINEIIYNRRCEEKNKIKLKPVKSDNEQLIYLFNDKIDDMDRNSNIFKNYITFKNLINNVLSRDLELNDILIGIKKLEIVEIILDKHQGDNPQKIFESINSTGLELSLADLIRNYLLMDDINQDKLYENYWLEIEKNVGYRNLGDFIINFLNSTIAKSINNQNAYRIFKEYCEENKLSHETILKKIKQTSIYYGAFIGENKYFNDKITTYLNAFNIIKQTTILPLLFKIFDDYENKNINEDILCKVLNYLLTYLIRITTCEINKNLSKFMKSMYERVINGNYDNYYEKFVNFLNNLKANDRMPTDRDFENALIYKPLYKKSICKYILSVIENSTKEHIDVNNLTIEHILPQKENAVIWKKELGDEYNKIYEIYLHTLGNLTFTGLNSELGTKSFNEKKKIIQDNSKANILNKNVLSADKWNERSIKNRAKILADILIKKFPYIEDNFTIIENTKLIYNADTNKDFSAIKPYGFSFIDEFIKVSSWVDLLNKFINIAYDLDKDTISELAIKNYSIPNATKVYLTNDMRRLRKPKQIGNSGIYYETHLPANNIISFIKSLLSSMNLDIDDFNFCISDIPFDINDENTWLEGSITVAKLFYIFIETLITKSKITSNEIEKLKTKNYTKSLFQATDYPAIANNINDNMGNSSQIRYRAKALKFDNEVLYITTQFFEKDRNSIIDWYKKHIS